MYFLTRCSGAVTALPYGNHDGWSVFWCRMIYSQRYDRAIFKFGVPFFCLFRLLLVDYCIVINSVCCFGLSLHPPLRGWE